MCIVLLNRVKTQLQLRKYIISDIAPQMHNLGAVNGSIRFTLYHHRTVPSTLSIPIENEAGWTTEQVVSIGFSYLKQQVLVDCISNVMAQAKKPDFFFWRNRQVHLKRQERQCIRLLAAEVCS